MKVHIFNHWFKFKVPIDKHWDGFLKDKILERPPGTYYSNFWRWLDDEYDVGQYYNWREERNYLVFHDKNHYLMFLLKL